MYWGLFEGFWVSNVRNQFLFFEDCEGGAWKELGVYELIVFYTWFSETYNCSTKWLRLSNSNSIMFLPSTLLMITLYNFPGDDHPSTTSNSTKTTLFRTSLCTTTSWLYSLPRYNCHRECESHICIVYIIYIPRIYQLLDIGINCKQMDVCIFALASKFYSCSFRVM